jgi:hypothetical protein
MLSKLQSHGVDGKFACGTMLAVVLEFQVLRAKSIRKMWAHAIANFENPTFDNFVRVPRNVADVVVQESGTTMTFVKRSSWFPSLRWDPSGTLWLLLAFPSCCCTP